MSCANMKVAIVLLSYLALGLAKPQAGLGSIITLQSKDAKVVGGHLAEAGQFPYIACLQRRGADEINLYCGGVILTENTILTAGHCITELPIDSRQYVSIKVGFTNLHNDGPNAQVSNVSKTIVHPDFNGGLRNPYDIGIYILTTPLTFTDFVQPIALPKVDEIPTGTAVLSGWGSISNDSIGRFPEDLMTVDVPIISYSDCKAAWDVVGGGDALREDSNMCTLSDGIGACNADSGGPLALNGTVVGIVSWYSFPCAQAAAPSVFTRVSAFIPWIQEQLAEANKLL